jgi:hypothetical protein
MMSRTVLRRRPTSVTSITISRFSTPIRGPPASNLSIFMLWPLFG